MIKVDLLSHTNVDPINLASHAAKVCYSSKLPKLGSQMDVEKNLFLKGHLTPFEHWYATFAIEGIAVSDITFGLHLASPFYNTCQRSGRYCAKMFLEPDYEKIKKYIQTFWSEVDDSKSEKIIGYVKSGVDVFHSHISEATEIAKKLLKKERSFMKEELLEQIAPKIAQEQMRNFIPTIFPTALDFTVDLIALAAMYESAWTPAMKFVTEEMARLVLEKFSDLGFMFKEERRRKEEKAVYIPRMFILNTKNKPKLKILGISSDEDFENPNTEMKHPLDKLHFTPETMNNSAGGIETEIEISVATMGQDQRHRTIGRGKPAFTGSFYTPPIVAELGLGKEAENIMQQWTDISREIPETLAMILAPYGAMVKYKKRGSFNAILHEQGKRLCWCAQEEIYHVGRLLRRAIESEKGKDSPLLGIFDPPCYRTGKCGEGDRYCGRDIKIRETGDYFPERKV